MAAFDVEGRYDAILCLFSAIGYVREPDRVTATLQCFLRHLEPGGAVLVEPWFTPTEWHPGRVYLHTRDMEGLTVARMSHSTVTGRMSHIELHYLVGRAGGVVHEVEHHELGLFTRSEMSACFEEAGFEDVVYDEVGLSGRGLYVATV